MPDDLGPRGEAARMPAARCFETIRAFASGEPSSTLLGTFMGRDAARLLAASLRGDSPRVLLPAYLCREVLHPFADATDVRFYDVQPDLVVDPERISEVLERDQPALVYLIHYFGVLQPFRREIAALCAERGALLVEDCAHSLLTTGSGETGDVQLYSFRKIIPLPDGGGLRVRASAAISGRFHPAIYSSVLSTLSLLKSRLKVRSEMLSRSGLALHAPASGNRPRSPASARVLPLSARARRMLQDAPLGEIVERRRAGYDFWRERVERSRHARPLFGELPPGTCPLGFPILVDERDAARARLRAAGVHLQVHWPLPSPESFVNSHRLARTICTLPVYPPPQAAEVQALESVLLQV